MLKLSRPPPVSHSRKKFTQDSRQSGCTHLLMTRLFDKYGAYKCDICDKHPSIGWLYRCTQDLNGFLPESDFQTTSARQYDKTKMHMDPSLHNLSPSVVRAIGQGHYTEEQIKMLVQQKEVVRLSILGHENRPTTASSSAETESSSVSGLPASTTFSSNTSSVTTLDEELRAAYDWAELQKVWLSDPTPSHPHRSGIDIEREEALQSIEPPDLTPCCFKICATCRPTYKERAYQSLDQVLMNPIMPPMWEFNNRRISDARIVAEIGLTKSHRFYADPSLDIDSGSSSLDLTPDKEDEIESLKDETDHDHSFRCRSGFRQTVRNALKRARPEQPFSFDDPGSHLSESQPIDGTPSTFSCSMLFLRRKSRPSASFVEPRASVVDNNSLQNSLMLMLATNAPLPESPTTPEFDACKRRESDPFAVTETSSAPDDMMRVVGNNWSDEMVENTDREWD